MRDFSLFPEEETLLDKLELDHKDCVPGNNFVATKYCVIFAITSIGDIPSFSCCCGENIVIACEERYDLL